MKLEHNNIDYGLYVDHKRAYIIALDHGIHEEPLEDLTVIKEDHVGGAQDINLQLHVQNKKNEVLKKFCKTVLTKVDRANRSLVFGPAEVKFEMRKEIEDNKTLKHVPHFVETCEYMDKDEAVRYATHYFKVKL